MAMSATRPVSRKREVVEPPKIARRDPRFSSLSASNTDANLSRASYAFLPGMLRDELGSLRTALAVASKAERSAPAAEREMRAAEREGIEGELARVRSRVERTEREEREREALRRVKKAEREKRAEGKGEWHLKRGKSGHSSLVSRPLIQSFRSRQEAAPPRSQVLGARGKGRTASRQEGNREEAEKGCAEGEAESAVCKGDGWGGGWIWRWRWWCS